mmetsp:Transcript_37272/g.95272  ORF Transcript_37272/g.95272 Transcript_37272/m.95272 type:complete len:129 (+) Transcript_37272:1051-1437(+)
MVAIRPSDAASAETRSPAAVLALIPGSRRLSTSPPPSPQGWDAELKLPIAAASKSCMTCTSCLDITAHVPSNSQQPSSADAPFLPAALIAAAGPCVQLHLKAGSRPCYLRHSPVVAKLKCTLHMSQIG